MSPTVPEAPVVVAMTGATGAIYGIRLLEALRELGVETHLVLSRWAEVTVRAETDWKPVDVRALATRAYNLEDPATVLPIAGMAVAPCSMRTLAAIAHGLADNLVQRAAEAHLRERRRLVLLVRESPLSVIHLDNMLRVAKAGAIVAPPVPAFYARPSSIEELVEHTVGRVLDLLDIQHDLGQRWGESRAARLHPVS